MVQNINECYSRMKFPYLEDRPIAMVGLEKRLIQTFGFVGGYGVVDDGRPGLLRRSLLWCRGFDQGSLKRIFSHSDEQRVLTDLEVPPPSWSWMAHEGAIDYLELPFGEVEWDESAIDSPWSGASMGTWDSSSDSDHGRTLRAIVHSILPGAWQKKDSQAIYDSPEKASEFGRDLKCVTLGRLKSRSQAHCALLVFPMNTDSNHHGGSLYERVGVGYLARDCVGLREPGFASIY